MIHQASHMQMQHYGTSTHDPADGAQPRAQQDQKPRCPAPECERTFSRQADVKRHLLEQHSPNQITFLCGCCIDKKKPPRFKRMEKLVNHKITFHGHAKSSTIRSCPEPTCQEEPATHRLLFCTEECFQHHMSQAHGISDFAGFMRHYETSGLEATTCK
jgi:hypothetical protein